MENHPIPQDVTGFQFKLIGDMTVKQFAYLAVGVILAWVFLQLPISILIKFPLSFFFAILGIGLAFFPVSGRPMDLMIGNFLKALFRPTQFVYEKTGGQLYLPANKTLKPTQVKKDFLPPQQDKLKLYLQTRDAVAKNPPAVTPGEVKGNLLVSLAPLSANPPPQSNINPTPPKPLANKPLQKAEPHYVKQIVFPVIKTTKRMPLPDAPDSQNLITGVTKDSRGNPLPNILVEIKDKEGNPVRAFKTNELGRFASATPLSNGSYTIELEDPKGQNRFEAKIINLTGQIIQPIEAISIDTREELRRSLFSPDASGLNN